MVDATLNENVFSSLGGGTEARKFWAPDSNATYPEKPRRSLLLLFVHCLWMFWFWLFFQVLGRTKQQSTVVVVVLVLTPTPHAAVSVAFWQLISCLFFSPLFWQCVWLLVRGSKIPFSILYNNGIYWAVLLLLYFRMCTTSLLSEMGLLEWLEGNWSSIRLVRWFYLESMHTSWGHTPSNGRTQKTTYLAKYTSTSLPPSPFTGRGWQVRGGWHQWGWQSQGMGATQIKKEKGGLKRKKYSVE